LPELSGEVEDLIGATDATPGNGWTVSLSS